MFLDISAGDKFLGMTPTESARKPKIDNWDYIKLKASGQQSKMKRQSREWEKIFIL